MKIMLELDGNRWCALIGNNLQEGVAGFGTCPYEALQRLMDVCDTPTAEQFETLSKINFYTMKD